MVDYYPLLSRAIVNLGESAGPDVRRAIYDRARTTLRSQLEEVDPPLPQDQIERERAQLEAVIARLEIEARARSKPATQAPLRYRRSTPERGRAHEDHRADDGSTDTVEPVPEMPHDFQHGLDPEEEGDPHGPLEGASKPARPPRRLPFIDWRIAALAVAVVLVTGTLAGLAYVLRDQVDPARREQAEQAAAASPVAAPRAAEPEAKNSARLGGSASPLAAAPAAAPSPKPVPAANSPQIAVAQRATLFIEVPGAADQVPRTVAGRVVWSFENLPSSPGQPLDPALVGLVDIPDAGISLRLQMIRNRDGTLPASYLVGLVFTTKDSNVKEIAPVLMKMDESERGAPLIGIQQPLGPNLFVMALSAADADVAKNFDLLSKRGWVEVQFRLADQRRGAIVFEKGIAGDRALLTAIDAWR
jgi:hypothetical protein